MTKAPVDLARLGGWCERQVFLVDDARRVVRAEVAIARSRWPGKSGIGLASNAI
jgi:hypothetical protein